MAPRFCRDVPRRLRHNIQTEPTTAFGHSRPYSSAHTIHAYMLARIHMHMRAHARAHAHARIHRCAHARTHTRTYAGAHALGAWCGCRDGRFRPSSVSLVGVLALPQGKIYRPIDQS